MTLTLLLQLTDDEQLYAEQVPVIAPVQEQAPVVPPADQAPTANWPEEDQCNG